MKHLTLITNSLLLLILISMGACQKDFNQEIQQFDIDPYTGRYEFNVTTSTMIGGELKTDQNAVIGFLQKESAISIKVIFDFEESGLDCVYEYFVRPDGTLVSTYKGAGDRQGSFLSNGVELSERLNLDGGDYRMVEIEGYLPSANP